MPQIVSGTTPEAEQEAAKLFERIAPEVVVVSPLEAEFAKLFNNAYRYIEFAATNEFYLIAKSAGRRLPARLEAMKHNYPRAQQHSAPGLCRRPVPGQGHDAAHRLRPQPVRPRPCRACWSTKAWCCTSSTISSAATTSPSMTVGLLGMAFKAESDDTRASLSYKFKKALRGQARAVLTTDPFVTTDPDLLPLDEVIAAQRSPDPVRAACRLSRPRLRGQAGGRRLGISAQGECDRLGVSRRATHRNADEPHVCFPDKARAA